MKIDNLFEGIFLERPNRFTVIFESVGINKKGTPSRPRSTTRIVASRSKVTPPPSIKSGKPQDQI